MSQFRYNGVTIPYARMNRFDQQTVYDELSGTDFYVTRFIIEVQGVLNFAYLSEICPDLVISSGADFTDKAADIMNIVRKRLLQPRRVLSVIIAGVELIPQVTGQVGSVDASNGPKPQVCSVQQLTDTTFSIVYSIQAEYWECANIQPGSVPLVKNSGPPTSLLWNRWSETVTVDNRNFSKREREGQFRIASNNPTGQLADQLRTQMAVVGVPNGFLRESSRYTISPDGLNINYLVVDQEVWALPPFPAYTADGEYIETTTNLGALRYGEVRVHLKADRLTDKGKLLETALLVAGSKLLRRAAYRGLPQMSTITSKLYDNDVEVRMRAQLKPDSDPSGKGRKQNFWGFRLDKITDTPYDGTAPFQPSYYPRGEISLLLQAASYHDPCLASRLDASTGQMTQGLAPGKAGVQKEQDGGTTPGDPFGADNLAAPTMQVGGLNLVIAVGTVNPDDFGAAYQELSPDLSIWTDYKIEAKYAKNRCIYHLPIASPNGFNGQSSAFVQLAAPVLDLLVDWTCCKTLEIPQIPDPDIGDNWVLMDDFLEPGMMVPAGDGQTVYYRISGTYFYGCKNPSDRTIDDVRFTRPPWLLDLFQRQVTSDKLYGGLIRDPTVTGSTGGSVGGGAEGSIGAGGGGTTGGGGGSVGGGGGGSFG